MIQPNKNSFLIVFCLTFLNISIGFCQTCIIEKKIAEYPEDIGIVKCKLNDSLFTMSYPKFNDFSSVDVDSLNVFLPKGVMKIKSKCFRDETGNSIVYAPSPIMQIPLICNIIELNKDNYLLIGYTTGRGYVNKYIYHLNSRSKHYEQVCFMSYNESVYRTESNLIFGIDKINNKVYINSGKSNMTSSYLFYFDDNCVLRKKNKKMIKKVACEAYNFSFNNFKLIKLKDDKNELYDLEFELK